MRRVAALALLALAGACLASAAEAGLRVYAAGDIAECPGPAADSDAARVAQLLPDDATVLMLGDAAYPRGDSATLARCYEPTWGRFRARTYAVPGNHDSIDGNARDFLGYFGARLPHATWFRVALGDWWLIGLDSNLKGADLARQAQWLRHELDAIRGDGRCLMAMWHHPLFSTGLHRGDGDPMRGAWRALDDAGADVVLSGHEHFYEAFDPLDARGKHHAAGIREFVVGTGGAGLVDFSLSGNHRAYAHVHGVLELELDPDHFRYGFHTVNGDVRDEGEAACRRPAATGPAAVTR
jgi:3',5'-cyclic AMP phosphodiesterase CpdA